jgi:hypothetical protein
MGDLFDGYPLGEVWDEMFGGAAPPRAAYAGLFASGPRAKGHTVTVEVTRRA